MRVLCVQLDGAWEDPPANARAVEALLDAHEVVPGSLIVLPETFATGFTMRAAAAEDAGGAAEQFLARVARERGSWVVAGVLARGSAGRTRNEAIVLGPAGDVLARYAKIHSFSFAGEHEHREAGSSVVTCACGPFVLAPFVCYDLRFPEVFREAVARGAGVYTVIANWPEERHEHWTSLLKARAIENQAYVVGVNRSGRDPAHAYAGGSTVLDPRGNVVAQAGREACVLAAEIDCAALEAYRAEFPALRDMRRVAACDCAKATISSAARS